MASLRSKSSQYSSVSSTRRSAGDALPSVAGMSAHRRTRRSAALPTRSLGYFAVPSSPRSGRPRSSSARYGTMSSDASSVSASRSSVELARQHSNGVPIPKLDLPKRDIESDLEAVTEAEQEPEAAPRSAPCARPSEDLPCAPPVAVLGQPRCAIEQDLFRLGDSVARLPCGHVFHRDCILPFVIRNRDGGYCPIDGNPVPRELASQLPEWRVSLADSRAPEVPDSVDGVSDAPSFARTAHRESDASARKWAPHFRETCVVDSARFRQGELCVRFASCGHVFHARCVRAYLAREPNPRCPIDGNFVSESDVKHVVVAGALERSGFSARPTRRPQSRLKDSRVRRAIRVLTRANDALRDMAALEHESDSRIRLQCMHERAESVSRRCVAMGDSPHSVNCEPRDMSCSETCAVDMQRLKLNERVVALECGHALHADCAATGAACGCAGAASGERRSGRFFELLPSLADSAASRWRCAELATSARECAAARAMDAAGDPKSGAALAEAAVAELRYSVRARRAALAVAPHAPVQRSNIASNLLRGDARRLSLPEKRLGSSIDMGMQGSSRSAPHLDDLSERISAGLSGLKQGRGAPRRASALTSALARDSVERTPPQPSVERRPLPEIVPQRAASEVARSAIARHLSLRSRRKRRGSRGGSADSEGTSFESIVSVDGSTRPRASLESRRGESLFNTHRKVSSECEHGNGQMCVIDAKAFEIGDELVRLPCMHIFHRNCVLPYLQQCDRPACPVDLTLINANSVHELPAWTHR